MSSGLGSERSRHRGEAHDAMAETSTRRRAARKRHTHDGSPTDSGIGKRPDGLQARVTAFSGGPALPPGRSRAERPRG